MLTISDLCVKLNNRKILSIENLALSRGQSLLVTGDNGSGKSTLAQVLAGKITNFDGRVLIDGKVSYLSFELESEIINYDRKYDMSEYLPGGVDVGRSVQNIIFENVKADYIQLAKIASLLDIECLLDKPFNVLSTGQTRLILIARALVETPDLLLLDEPFAGLDIHACKRITNIIDNLVTSGVNIILFDFYNVLLPNRIKNVLLLDKGDVHFLGERKSIEVKLLKGDSTLKDIDLLKMFSAYGRADQPEVFSPYIKLNNVTLSFNTKNVWQKLNWQLNKGEHWKITGPNGCGKSELLAMVSGDSTKAYGKELYLFGAKRGSGETIWDIKQHFGVVNTKIHRDYTTSTSVIGVVLSGFFDTIGVYQPVEMYQIKQAEYWLDILGFKVKKEHLFKDLSYGEQRLLLIARAMVKSPLLLILDEACQGLDNVNKHKVFDLMDSIAKYTNTQIIFVSHGGESPSFITHELTFIKEMMGYTAKSEAYIT